MTFNLKQQTEDRLLYLLARTGLNFSTAIETAVEKYCDDEELRLKMESDYEAGNFGAISA